MRIFFALFLMMVMGAAAQARCYMGHGQWLPEDCDWQHPPSVDMPKQEESLEGIDSCANELYQLSVGSFSDGYLTVLLQDRNSNLLGQYQVHIVETPNELVGSGFHLFVQNDVNSPTGRTGHFSAEIAITGENISGQMTCEENKTQIEPPGKPQCLGMSRPIYIGGHWHCLHETH